MKRPHERSGERSATLRPSRPLDRPASGRSGAFRWRRRAAPRSAACLPSEAQAEIFYDWAGGLVWAALRPSDDARASLVRPAVAAAGGHATLIRAPAAVRAAVDVFEPQAAGAGGIDQAGAGELRSARRAQCRSDVGGSFSHADVFHPRATRRSATWPSRKRFCAPACIAAFAPPRVRPTCWTATSSIRRAAASTSSRTCWRTIGRRRPKSRCISIVACRASPA